MKKAAIDFWRKGYFYILLAGILVVVFLIDSRVGMYDWKKELAYFNLIKISLTQYNSLPLFWWNSQALSSYPAISVSSFFLANPETFSLSPFVFLLYWMDTLFFMKFLVCIFCAISVIGILKLSKKLNWQDGQCRIFIAVFLFSPIIIQHLAIGYFPWLNLYLFPWLIYFLIDEEFIRRVLGCASILAFTLLQGGIHPFVWMLFFIGFYSAVRFIQKPGFRIILFLVALIALSMLLSLVRISTSAQTYADFKQVFFNGYSLNGFVTWGLTPPVFTPADMDDIEPYIESYNNGVPYWDGAIYWGAVQPLVLVFFIVLVDQKLSHKEKKKGDEPKIFFSLAVASLLITLLSFGHVYQGLITAVAEWTRIPAMEAVEKYPFRFAILGYFGFSIVISYYFYEILDAIKKPIAAFLSFLSLEKKKSPRIGIVAIIKGLLILSLIFSAFYLIIIIFRPSFFSWLEPAIQSAYRNEGNPWLAGLMSRRSTIPITAYIQKAYALFNGIQTILLMGMLSGWLIYLLLRFSRPIAAFLFPFIQSLQNRMSFLLEVILIVPLFFTSAMWMRVALATPYKGGLPEDLIAPEIEIQPTLSSFKLTTAPSQISILLDKPGEDQKIVLSNIQYSDLRFLQADDPKTSWFNSNGFLGLSTGNDAQIVVRVKPESYLPALWITVVSWLMVVGVLIFSIIKKNHKKGI